MHRPEGGDQDVVLRVEVVRDPACGATSDLRDAPHRRRLEALVGDDRPGGGHELLSPLRMVDHLRHELQPRGCKTLVARTADAQA